MIRAARFVLAVVVALTACESAPTSKSMVKNYRENEQAFSQLRQMFSADTTLQFIDKNSIDPEGAVTLERAGKYRRLLNEVGAYAARGYGESTSVTLVRYGIGLSISGQSKGYKYTPDPNVAVVDDIDAYATEARKDMRRGDISSAYALQKIEDHWYLYVSMD